MDSPTLQIQRLLQEWREGDQCALDRLLPLVYSDLHRMAKLYMGRERPGHTLQATALVHESYLRLLASADRAGRTKPTSLRCARERCAEFWSTGPVPGSPRNLVRNEDALSCQEVLNGIVAARAAIWWRWTMP